MHLPTAPAKTNSSAAEKGKNSPPRSTLISRNVTINGHRTSVRLEPEMWTSLNEICRRERATPHEVCSAIASHKEEHSSLTAAIRVFVMKYYRVAATEEGHAKAGHGNGIALGIANMMAQSIISNAQQHGSRLATSSSPYMIGGNHSAGLKNRAL